MIRILTIVFIALSVKCFAQDKITTFILVRHAEKAMDQSTNDPDLSSQGKVRAQKLADLLKETDVTAIYSTATKRTRQTVEHLAQQKNITVMEYGVNKVEDVDAMLAKHAGGTIVVVGHSNTVPWFMNTLLGVQKYHPFEDGDYDNVIIVSVLKKGELAKLLWVNY